MVVRAARNAASSTTPAISLAALSASHGSSSDGHAAMAMAMQVTAATSFIALLLLLFLTPFLLLLPNQVPSAGRRVSEMMFCFLGPSFYKKIS